MEVASNLYKGYQGEGIEVGRGRQRGRGRGIGIEGEIGREGERETMEAYKKNIRHFILQVQKLQQH